MGILFTLTMLFAACGGGGGSSSGGESNTENNIFHKMELTKTSTKTDFNLILAENAGSIIHLVKNGKVAKVPISEIKEVYVEGFVVGYISSGGGRRVLMGNTANIIIENVAVDDAILVTVVTKLEEKYFLNPDSTTFAGSTRMVVRDGLMWYGMAADDPCFSDQSVVILPIEPPIVIPPVQPPVSEPMHTITVSGGIMIINFATVDGYIVELVKNGVSTPLRITDVRQVVWNGDVAGWSLATSNPYGVVVTIPENSAVSAVPVPVHDNGILRIVDRLGNVYSINTAKIAGLSITTDGRQLITF
ncbi:MAG: hypothetical protein ACD_8C00104G0005 [uncultured bacterium]|nr:MAG: hypothetical protein ACD_8C00104G0005 [uncultured bacterium]